jgi:hypothetical protein
MDEITTVIAPEIVAAYDFNRARLVVDIAGGRGVLLAEILRHVPTARGILLDRPQVIEAASNLLDGEIVGRIELLSCSFFQQVPAGGDPYILKNILHDWNDDAALEILTTCRRSICHEAKLLIIGHIVGLANETSVGEVGDIQVMVRRGGRNRTELEFRNLLRKGGFHLCRVIQTGSGPALIEASTDD